MKGGEFLRIVPSPSAALHAEDAVEVHPVSEIVVRVIVAASEAGNPILHDQWLNPARIIARGRVDRCI
jgi:hypothetical protein